jgi:peptidoglycan hydrolase CwlO-like protein
MSIVVKIDKDKLRQASGIDSDVQQINQNITDLQNSINTTNSNVSNLQNTVNQIQNDVNTLKTMKVYVNDVEIGQVQVTS